MKAKVPSLHIPSLKKEQLYTIGVVAVLLIVFVVMFTIYRKRIKVWVQEKKQEHEMEQAIDRSNLTATSTTLKQYADQLYTAMKGWGTDEVLIYDVFSKVNTDDDVLEIIRIFGIKDNMTLPQWIVDELNTKERTKLNTILTNKGIMYQF